MAIGEVLEWDSEFFGYRVARLEPASLEPGNSDDVAAWLQKVRPRCVYLLVDPVSSVQMASAIDLGFKKICTRVELVNARLSGIGDGRVDIVSSPSTQYLRRLENLAAGIFLYSRFYQDPQFGSGKASELFSVWVKNSLADPQSLLFCHTNREGEPDGFLLLKTANMTAVMDLLGVDPNSRNKGVGERLVQAALQFAREEAVQSLSVVTQLENEGAMKLYEKTGFEVGDTKSWLHAWLHW